MRILPPLTLRREVVGKLRDFYAEGERVLFNEALKSLCGYYGVGMPRIRWKRRILNGQALGLTWEDGLIELIPPKVWKNRKTENTEDEFVATVLHELHHHIFWANAERKADKFASDLMRAEAV